LRNGAPAFGAHPPAFRGINESALRTAFHVFWLRVFKADDRSF
jgi:hypothetical protein